MSEPESKGGSTKLGYLLKNTGVLAIGNFASKILVFLMLPLYTAVLSTAEYGSYDIIFSSVSLLVPILTLNISEALVRFPLEDNPDIHGLIRISGVVLFASTFIVLIGQLIPGTPWSNFPGSEYIAVFYFSTAIFQMATQFARGEEDFAGVAIAGLLGTIITLGLNLSLLLALKLGLDGFFIANILGMLLPSIYLIIRHWDDFAAKSTEQKSSKLAWAMIKYSFPLALTTIGWWFVNVSDRYIVLFFCGVEANGLYSVSYKIPTIISTIAAIFIQAWQVSVIKEAGNPESNRFLSRVFGAVEGMLSIACSALIPLSPLLAFFLFSGEFYEAWRYVPFLLVYVTMTYQASLVSPFFSFSYKNAPIAASTILAGLVNVGLGIPLVYLFGVQGAAFSSLVAGFITWVYRSLSVRGLTSISLHRSRTLSVFSLLLVQATIQIMELPVQFCLGIEIVLLVCVVFSYRGNLRECFNLVKNILSKSK